MIDQPTITITVDEYNRLQESDSILEALLAAGVDNWEGYSMAFEFLEEGKNEDE